MVDWVHIFQGNSTNTDNLNAKVNINEISNNLIALIKSFQNDKIDKLIQKNKDNGYRWTIWYWKNQTRKIVGISLNLKLSADS